jgi:hypothetical protein
MTAVAEAIWLRLHVVLTAFADQLAAADSALISDLGRSANDTFLLRAYLSFRRHNDGNEVAITVDVQSKGQQLTIESDACSDDGKVIASGPSAAIPLSTIPSNVDSAIDDWLCEFDRWLLVSELAIAKAASRLS